MKFRPVLLTLMAAAVMPALSAQKNTDGGATEIMRQLSAKYQTFRSMNFQYTLKIGQDNKTQETYQGTLTVAGDKYNNHAGNGTTLICDGQSLWNYDSENNEVAVYEYDGEDSYSLFSPQKFLADWEKMFRAKLIRDEYVKGRQNTLIDMTPKTAQSYYKVRLFVDRAAQQVLQAVVYDKNSMTYTFCIEQFRADVKADPSLFVFDASKHPGIEVVDMR